MRKWCLRYLLCSAALVAVSPAFAKGKHVSCHLTGLIMEATGEKRIERTLNFYLDDTNEKLVGESGDIIKGTNLNARTTRYSDVEIVAEISTGMAGEIIFYGRVTNGPTSLRIDRVTGQAALIGNLLPRGSDMEVGPCREIAPPPTKF
jgi:hypothetical protein